MKNLKTLSCFSGIGGFELAAQAVGGFNVTTAIEKDPYRQKVLKKNFPDLIIEDDITQYYPNEEFDLVVGGFPCKGMSYAGKGEGYANKHTALWWDMLRVIAECRPSFVIIENVRGFMHRGLRQCLASLAMAGYNFDVPQIISAKEVGACHLRERIFVVAYADSLVWREQPRCWSGQARCQIEAVRNAATAHSRRSSPPGDDWDAKRPSSSVRQRQTESQSSCIQRRNSLETETERSDETGTWAEPGRSSVSCRETDSSRPQFPPFIQGVATGFSGKLDGFRQDGWWLENPFVGEVSAPRRTVPNRQQRISALGDTVTPQQAAIPLMRVKYLTELLQK